MIYIFQGCQSICSLPGMCCKAIGNCCQAINCKPIKECCDSCGKGCTHFMERPLSTFVIVSFVLSFVQIYFCYTSLSSKCKFSDSAAIGQSIWVIIELAFAVINIIFALYFQRQVWNNIWAKKDEFSSSVSQEQGRAAQAVGALRGGIKNLRGAAGGTNAPAEEPLEEKDDKGGKILVPPEAVQASFKQVFLQDFGVLAYFFGLIVIFVLSFMGKSSIGDNADCSSETVAYYLGLAFFWVAFIYTFMWYCCKCCAGTVKIERDEGEEMA